MARKVSFAELREATPEKRKSLLGGMVEEARSPANGKIEEIEDQIAEFERVYEMPSDEMIQEVYRGTLRETDEIASWLMLVNLRKRMRAHQPG